MTTVIGAGVNRKATPSRAYFYDPIFLGDLKFPTDTVLFSQRGFFEGGVFGFEGCTRIAEGLIEEFLE